MTVPDAAGRSNTSEFGIATRFSDITELGFTRAASPALTESTLDKLPSRVLAAPADFTELEVLF